MFRCYWQSKSYDHTYEGKPKYVQSHIFMTLLILTVLLPFPPPNVSGFCITKSFSFLWVIPLYTSNGIIIIALLIITAQKAPFFEHPLCDKHCARYFIIQTKTSPLGICLFGREISWGPWRLKGLAVSTHLINGQFKIWISLSGYRDELLRNILQFLTLSVCLLFISSVSYKSNKRSRTVL